MARRQQSLYRRSTIEFSESIYDTRNVGESSTVKVGKRCIDCSGAKAPNMLAPRLKGATPKKARSIDRQLDT